MAHGPHPRKYHKKVSKKVGQLAFQRAFSAKVDQGDIVVVEDLSVSAPKTREFAGLMKNLGLDRSALFIVDAGNENLQLAARNIPKVEIATAALVNTYQLLRYKHIVVTQAGMQALESRLA